MMLEDDLHMSVADPVNTVLKDRKTEILTAFNQLSDDEQYSFIVGLVAKRMLPDGYVSGGQWRAKDPRRSNSASKSISVNLVTGYWQSFGTSKRGIGPVTLISYVAGLNKDEAEAANDKMCIELQGGSGHET